MPQELIDRLNSALEQEGFPPLFEQGMFVDRVVSALGLLVWIGSAKGGWESIMEREALQKLFHRGQVKQEAA